ncbi:APC family permease [Thermogemmatispora onikobensis]|uniref:APC family permease n=1 Tax=Thermogemmatispora onikobensis TaxID=732234 RepID=UPI0008530856|nr:APC family permease [Thermogemmatispora onikobensis]
MEEESPAAQLATHPPSGRALPSEHYVERVMPPVLGTVDLTAIFFAAIFYLTNSATAATAGVVSFLYWLICGVAFFLPCVLSTAQLGLLFPYEGALYNWTYRTLGTFWGFFAAFCAWLPGILAFVSGFGTAITYLQGLHQGWLTAPWQQGAVLAFLIVIGTALTVQPLRVLQRVLNVTVGLLLLAVLLITVAAFVWLLTGHTSATTFGHLADWQPGPDNFVLFGFLIQSYLGTEVPLALAGEVRLEQRRQAIRSHLRWGSLLVVASYLFTTLAVLVVRGPQGASDPVAFISLVDQALGRIAGNATAVCLLCFFMIAPLIYNYTFARLLLVAAIDGHLPTGLARLNRARAPANAIYFQSAVALVFTALSYFVLPYLFPIGQPADLSTIIFTVSLAALTLVWLISIPFLFIDVLVAARRQPALFQEHRILPYPLFWLLALLGTLSCLLAIVDTLLNSWIPDLLTPTAWWLAVGGTTLACLTLGLLGSMVARGEASWERWRGQAGL